MSHATTKSAPMATIADLLVRLGNVPARRVRLHPLPGTATENDVLAVEARENRLCELVAGTLVEKVRGYEESALACFLITYLVSYARPRKLGLVTGPDGTIRLMPGLVRIPDVAFLSRARYPAGKAPREPIPELAPDLVVEIMSKGNTKREMRLKLREYLRAGVRLVWYVDLKTRSVQVFTAIDQSVTPHEGDALDGGDVLPGFTLPLRQLFGARDD